MPFPLRESPVARTPQGRRDHAALRGLGEQIREKEAEGWQRRRPVDLTPRRLRDGVRMSLGATLVKGASYMKVGSQKVEGPFPNATRLVGILAPSNPGFGFDSRSYGGRRRARPSDVVSVSLKHPQAGVTPRLTKVKASVELNIGSQRRTFSTDLVAGAEGTWQGNGLELSQLDDGSFSIKVAGRSALVPEQRVEPFLPG